MENIINPEWTSDHEASYMEERKYRCEHCDPEDELTTRWLESTSAQDMIFTVYKQYGIPPHIIYKEYAAEISTSEFDQEVLEEFMEELA